MFGSMVSKITRMSGVLLTCMLLLMSDVNGELTQGPNRFPRNLIGRTEITISSKGVGVVNLSIDIVVEDDLQCHSTNENWKETRTQ